MSEVSIIILTWNQANYTVPCVESVLKQKGDFEIIILDNGSEDDSVRIFKKEFGTNKKIKIVVAPENLGYAGGNNLGVKHAKGEFIVILNNDTEVEKDWLKELVKGIKSDKSIGAVNSFEIRNGKIPPLNYNKYYDMRLNVLTYSVRVKRKNSLKNIELIDSASINGCSFIYRKNILDKPFDEDYFAYAEDTKAAWILKCKGYKIKLATKSVVNHYHNATRKSNKKFNFEAVFLNERNRLMNVLTFYGAWTTLKLQPVLLFNIVAVNIIQPKYIFMRLKAYFWLLLHIDMILRKREEIKNIKVISDKELLKDLTWRLWPTSASSYGKHL